MKQIKTQNELDEAIKAGETDVEFVEKGKFEINCKFLKVSVKEALMWDVLLEARGSSSVDEASDVKEKQAD